MPKERRRHGTIARNIELYSSAYRHRLEADFPLRKREQPDISLRLHGSIRRQLKDGATDALSIATESESGTLKPQES